MTQIERHAFGVESDNFKLCSPDVGRDFGQPVFLRQDVHVVDVVAANVAISWQRTSPEKKVFCNG